MLQFLGPILGMIGTWLIGSITKLPMKLRPFVAVAAGVVINLFVNGTVGDGVQAQDITDGIIIGLSAVGVYSTSKNVVQDIKSRLG